MTKTLLIKDVLLNGRTTNILIENNLFKDLDAPSDMQADQVIDGSGKAIVPPFYNTHNHAAMIQLRGYADDMALDKWLREYIWPYEDKMTSREIRLGSDRAVHEMVSSGTAAFYDMYFDIDETIQSVLQSGMRANIGITVMENHSRAQQEEKLKYIKNWRDPSGGRINLSMAPHAIYTVGTEKLRMAAQVARENDIPIQIHLSETRLEVENCLREHGTTPVRYLDSIGFLGPDVVASHCVHVDEEEWDILAGRGVSVAHCPGSNMKLASGRFPYELAIASGCNICLGTDGASSDNNLDLREKMKFASLLAKVDGDPSLLPADMIFKWATENGARAMRLNAGRIEAGCLADALLLDLSNSRLIPCHNLISNLVYAADRTCIDTVICDGKVIFSC